MPLKPNRTYPLKLHINQQRPVFKQIFAKKRLAAASWSGNLSTQVIA